MERPSDRFADRELKDRCLSRIKGSRKSVLWGSQIARAITSSLVAEDKRYPAERDGKRAEVRNSNSHQSWISAEVVPAELRPDDQLDRASSFQAPRVPYPECEPGKRCRGRPVDSHASPFRAEAWYSLFPSIGSAVSASSSAPGSRFQNAHPRSGWATICTWPPSPQTAARDGSQRSQWAQCRQARSSGVTATAAGSWS